MRKKLIMITVAAVTAVALVLAGCQTSESVLATDMAEDGKSMDIIADGAEEGDFVSTGSLIVGEGDMVVTEGDFDEDGSVEISLVATVAGTDGEISQEDLEGLTDAEEKVMTEPITGKETKQHYVAAGEYYVTVTAKNKVTGTARVTVQSPEEQKQDGSKDEAAEEDGQNPIMNYVGPYVAGRGEIMIEADGMEDAKATVTWGSSAAEVSQWTLTGTFDPETKTIEYHDCVKKDQVYGEDGKVKSEEEVYQGGHGFMTFKDGKKGTTLTWQDDQEHIADDTTFEFNAGAE